MGEYDSSFWEYSCCFYFDAITPVLGSAILMGSTFLFHLEVLHFIYLHWEVLSKALAIFKRHIQLYLYCSLQLGFAPLFHIERSQSICCPIDMMV